MCIWQLANRQCTRLQVHNVAAASNAALQQDVKTPAGGDGEADG